MGVENFLLDTAKTYHVKLTINKQKQKAKIPKTWTKEEVMEKLAQKKKEEKRQGHQKGNSAPAVFADTASAHEYGKGHYARSIARSEVGGAALQKFCAWH